MDKPKAHVSEVKKKEVKLLKEILSKNEIIGILDLTNLPSAQFQKLKNKLKKVMSIRVSKKSLIKLAISSSIENKKGIEKLEEYLENTMPALLVSKEDPFKLSNKLLKNKSRMAAKPGQISPKNIEIPEGPTSFPAGPVVGELGAAGIKAAIEDGKVVVKESKIIVKEGEVINQKVSDLLAKFNIEPMEIGLNLIAVYQNGDILTKEVLSIDGDKVLNDIKAIANEAFNLAIFSGYPSKDTVGLLLTKAESESIALSKKIPEDKPSEDKPAEDKPAEDKPAEDKPAEDKSQSENQSDNKNQRGPSDYSEEDAKKAQELINQVKDSNGG